MTYIDYGGSLVHTKEDFQEYMLWVDFFTAFQQPEEEYQGGSSWIYTPYVDPNVSDDVQEFLNDSIDKIESNPQPPPPPVYAKQTFNIFLSDSIPPGEDRIYFASTDGSLRALKVIATANADGSLTVALSDAYGPISTTELPDVFGEPFTVFTQFDTTKVVMEISTADATAISTSWLTGRTYLSFDYTLLDGVYPATEAEISSLTFSDDFVDTYAAFYLIPESVTLEAYVMISPHSAAHDLTSRDNPMYSSHVLATVPDDLRLLSAGQVWADDASHVLISTAPILQMTIATESAVHLLGSSLASQASSATHVLADTGVSGFPVSVSSVGTSTHVLTDTGQRNIILSAKVPLYAADCIHYQFPQFDLLLNQDLYPQGSGHSLASTEVGLLSWRDSLRRVYSAMTYHRADEVAGMVVTEIIGTVADSEHRHEATIAAPVVLTIDNAFHELDSPQIGAWVDKARHYLVTRVKQHVIPANSTHSFVPAASVMPHLYIYPSGAYHSLFTKDEVSPDSTAHDHYAGTVTGKTRYRRLYV